MANKTRTRKTEKTIKSNVAPRGFVLVPKKAFTKMIKLYGGIDALNLASYGV